MKMESTTFFGRALSIVLVLALVLVSDPLKTNAIEYDYYTARDASYYAEPQLARVTCYCDYGYTASGKYVRHGVIASKKEWIGMTALVYSVREDGGIDKLIGIYECLDTGYGINGSLQNGTSFDVWCPSLDACYEWIGEYGDYCYVQLIKSFG